MSRLAQDSPGLLPGRGRITSSAHAPSENVVQCGLVNCTVTCLLLGSPGGASRSGSFRPGSRKEVLWCRDQEMGRRGFESQCMWGPIPGTRRRGLGRRSRGKDGAFSSRSGLQVTRTSSTGGRGTVWSCPRVSLRPEGRAPLHTQGTGCE